MAKDRVAFNRYDGNWICPARGPGRRARGAAGAPLRAHIHRSAGRRDPGPGAALPRCGRTLNHGRA